MTDRERIIEILINHSTTSCNDDEITIKVIFQEQFNRIASDILPLLEKRDEIIESLEQLDYYKNRTDVNYGQAEESHRKVFELRQKIETLKKEIQ